MYEGFRFINSIRKKLCHSLLIKSVNVVSKIFQREKTNDEDASTIDRRWNNLARYRKNKMIF